MSVKVTALVWDHFPFGGGEYLTALALSDHADDTGGRIYPSVKRLAAKTQQSERTVQYHLKAMLKIGWLQVVERGGAGAGKSTRYRIPIELIPRDAVGRVQNLHPAESSTKEAGRVQPDTNKGATAIAPESSRTVSKDNRQEAGRAKAPSPVAAAFHAYQQGIKDRYQAEYPPSAKANGQLAQVVGRVGAEAAVQVVTAYLGHQDGFYAKTKHSLDFLVRDCEKIWLELQAAKTASQPKAPTHARVALLRADGTVIKELDESPAGNMETIAKAAASRYAHMIANFKPKYLGVRQGSERRRFSIEELRG